MGGGHRAEVFLGWLPLLFIIGHGWAGGLTLDFTAPRFNADSTNICQDDSLAPLTDLSRVLLYGVRSGTVDTTLLWESPAQAGESLSVSVNLPDGTTGTLWVMNEDWVGNRSCPSPSVTYAFPATGALPGLQGDYYDNTDFTGFHFSQVDSQIAFNWDGLGPGGGITRSDWSARWTGQISTRAAGTYLFSAHFGKGFRLWIGGGLVIDDWRFMDQRTDTASVYLDANQTLDLRAEYYDIYDFDDAVCVLSWRPPGELLSVVPASALTRVGVVTGVEDGGAPAPEGRALWSFYVDVAGRRLRGAPLRSGVYWKVDLFPNWRKVHKIVISR